MNNSEDLRDIWSKGQEPAGEFGSGALDVKGALSSIERIRQNMRMELYMLLFTLAAGIALLIFYPPEPQTAALTWMILALLLAATLFFAQKVFRFYRKSFSMVFNTRESLIWFMYEVRLLIEMYRSYGITCISGGFFIGLIHGITRHAAMAERDFLALPVITFTAGIAVNLLVYFVIEFWLYWFYGRYVRRI
ncbi:MAG: hypothetical protein ACK5CH_00200, partial [Bacteroidota bacterium]